MFPMFLGNKANISILLHLEKVLEILRSSINFIFLFNCNEKEQVLGLVVFRFVFPSRRDIETKSSSVLDCGISSKVGIALPEFDSELKTIQCITLLPVSWFRKLCSPC